MINFFNQRIFSASKFLFVSYLRPIVIIPLIALLFPQNNLNTYIEVNMLILMNLGIISSFNQILLRNFMLDLPEFNKNFQSISLSLKYRVIFIIFALTIIVFNLLNVTNILESSYLKFLIYLNLILVLISSFLELTFLEKDEVTLLNNIKSKAGLFVFALIIVMILIGQFNLVLFTITIGPIFIIIKLLLVKYKSYTKLIDIDNNQTSVNIAQMFNIIIFIIGNFIFHYFFIIQILEFVDNETVEYKTTFLLILRFLTPLVTILAIPISQYLPKLYLDFNNKDYLQLKKTLVYLIILNLIILFMASIIYLMLSKQDLTNISSLNFMMLFIISRLTSVNLQIVNFFNKPIAPIILFLCYLLDSIQFLNIFDVYLIILVFSLLSPLYIYGKIIKK